MGYADAMNRMAYPTEAQREAQDAQIDNIQTMNTANEVQRAQVMQRRATV